MPELTNDFQSLPQEYQHVIRLAQDTYQITVAPLQYWLGDGQAQSSIWSAFRQTIPNASSIAFSNWIAKAKTPGLMKSRGITR